MQNSIISFQPTEQTLAEVGQSIGQIQITLNKQTITSYPFFLNVSKNYVLNASIESTDEFLVLDNLIDEAQKTTAEMKALMQKFTTQENARVEAEKKRVSAENARVQAENKRQTDTSSAISKANTATTNANNAANNANSKATLANNAATNANNAASTAESAATKVNSAIAGIPVEIKKLINDTSVSSTTTYSSTKINSLFASANIKAITNSQIDSLGTL